VDSDAASAGTTVTVVFVSVLELEPHSEEAEERFVRSFFVMSAVRSDSAVSTGRSSIYFVAFNLSVLVIVTDAGGEARAMDRGIFHPLGQGKRASRR
jgi:ATP-dependent phosphoenolpyruvate carboxykinase